MEIARLPDETVSRLYSIGTKITFHGGTSIWRCYGGKRFSYDLDLYTKSPDEIVKSVDNLRSYGLSVKAAKMRKDARPIEYYTVSNGRATITLEFAQKRTVDKVVATYIKTDGSGIDIFSLSPESLILEKIEAYNSRRAIKDLYDVFILVHTVETSKTKAEIMKFLDKIKPPLDENTLSQLVYDGPIPSFKEMVSYIKRKYEIR